MDARETAPSAERNKQPIVEVLARVLPASGLVLEIGSGTGQHVARARGFALEDTVAMPANNFTLVFRRLAAAHQAASIAVQGRLRR